MSHLYQPPLGDEMAQFALDQEGHGPGFGSPGSSTCANGTCVQMGFVSFPDPRVADGTDINWALYYSTAADPVYTTGLVSAPDGGGQCDYGALNSYGPRFMFHAPNNAIYGNSLAGGDVDEYLAIYDQDKGLLVNFYSYNHDLSLGVCGDGGHAGTFADPCMVPYSHCSAGRAGVDRDWGLGAVFPATVADSDGGLHGYALGGSFSTGDWSPWTCFLRMSELQAGAVNHALSLRAYCSASQVVFPTLRYPGTQCVSLGEDGGHPPPVGALFFLDYTPAQILAMRLPAWQETLLTTLSTYGGYFSQTAGEPDAGMGVIGLESQTPWSVYYDVTNPFIAWANSNELCDLTPGGCPTTGLLATSPAGNVFWGIPLEPGPGSPDSSGRACAAGGGGCDVSGHLHMADPCVAEGLAGLDAGCR